MEFWKNKRRIVTATAILLILMLLCTLISKSVYACSLPQVTVEEAKKKTLGRQIRVSGTVMQSREYAVSTLPSIRVDSVEVGRGDEVEDGTLLFTLDTQDLREQIAQQELSIKKLEVQIATQQYNQKLADEKKVRDTNRLLEDYVDASAENDIAIDRAKIKENEAKQELKKHLEDAPQITDNEGREEARKAYKDWEERSELLQEEADRLTKELAAAQKRVEEAQAALDAAKQEAEGKSAGTEFSAERIVIVDCLQTEEERTAPPAPACSGEECADVPEVLSDSPDSAEGPEDAAELGSAAGPEDSTELGDTAESEDSTEPEASTNPDDSVGSAPSEEPLPDLSALQKRLDDAIAERDAYAAELENIQEKLRKHLAEAKTEPDFSAEDAELKSWESQSEALKRNAESVEWAYEDALRQKEKTLEEAQRKVDDSVTSEDLQDTFVLNQLELEWQREVLKGYQKLQDQEGKITAKQKGVITAVNVTAGNDTPDGAAVVYADKEENLEFRMTLTKEEKKYINQGTQGSLLIGNDQENCAVEYLEQQSDGSYLAIVSLPEGMGTIGESGTFTVSWQSQTYQRCIPLNALHEENQRRYIYVVRRQQGILGEELAAEKRFVTLLEQGDTYAALDPTDLAEGEKVILTTTKALTDGEVIRYRLQPDSTELNK